MSEHALLSASGSHKWLHCTPSARLEETLPKATSEYAEEGRLAHEIAELKLRKGFTEPMGSRTFNSRLKKLKENPLFKEEMLRHTDVYLDYVSKIAHECNSTPYIAVEKKINYGAYAPEGFGTCDCILIHGETMHIIDFKYGKGVPVSAYMNPQMLLYALGAYEQYSLLYQIERVKIVIMQPRLDSISEHDISIEHLLKFGTDIKPIAQKAFNGEGDFVPGEHCRFCRAKSLCRARAEFNTNLEEFNYMKPPIISNDEIGQILAKAQNLVKWVKDLEEYALAECLKGNTVSGWKAVHGRSIRQFTNQEEAFKKLIESGVEETMLYKREALSLAKIEDLIGKKEAENLLSNFIVTPPGKPTLVIENDKREAISNTVSVEQAFGNNNNNLNGGTDNG